MSNVTCFVGSASPFSIPLDSLPISRCQDRSRLDRSLPRVFLSPFPPPRYRILRQPRDRATRRPGASRHAAGLPDILTQMTAFFSAAASTEITEGEPARGM